MKKLTFLLALLAFAGIGFAQTASYTLSDINNIEEKVELPAVKASGDVFWSEDFDEDDWISTVTQGSKGGYLYNESDMPGSWAYDNLGEGFYWHWSDVGPRGAYVASSSLVPENNYITNFNWPDGTTLENGFVMLESDFYNTSSIGEPIDPAIEMDSYLGFGPIDCSNRSSVILTFNTLYVFCCDDPTFEIQVSTDYNPANVGSEKWTSFKVNKLTPANEFTYVDERHVEINISGVATNESSVYFRLHTTGSSAYFIMLDDIMLMEGPENDIIIADGWAEYMYLFDDADYFSGGYTQIPKDLVSNFTMFRVAAFNNGSNEATNAVLTAQVVKDDEVLFSDLSEEKNIASLNTDTLKIYTSFTPAELGTYQISMTLDMDAEDEVSNNNYWGYEFETTTSRYSRVRHDASNSFTGAGPRDWVSGGSEADIVAVSYDIEEGSSVEFSGINVFIYPITSTEELDAIGRGDFQMKAVVYKINADDGEYENLNFGSELYTLTYADTGTWVYLPFANEGNLVQSNGSYVVGIETSTGTHQDLRFEVGDDAKGVKQPYYGSMWYSNEKRNWYTATGNNYAIDLMVNYNVVILTLNYDMSGEVASGNFNPAYDKVYVTGSFSDWAVPGTEGSLLMGYNSSTKKATARIVFDANISGMTIEYKAYINEGKSGAEWDDDEKDPRSVYIDVQDVELDHYFSWPTAVSESELSVVKFYPNPFSNTLMLDNISKSSDVIISNVVGQTIMSVSSVVGSIEISTANLESGIYFITLTDGENVRTERVVKQ